MASWTRRASAGSLWITTSSEMGGPTSLMESISHRMAEGTGLDLLTHCQGRLAWFTNRPRARLQAKGLPGVLFPMTTGRALQRALPSLWTRANPGNGAVG